MNSFLKTGLLHIVIAIFGILFTSCSTNDDNTEQINHQLLEQLSNRRMQLPNGWSLTPPGKSLQLGDFPLNMVKSSSEKYMAITNNGQSVHSIMLFSIGNGVKLLDEAEIPKAWFGMKFSPDDSKLYVSGGNDNVIRIYNIVEDKLVETNSIILGDPWPNKIGPTGLDIDFNSNTLYTVTKEDSAMYICNIDQLKVDQRIQLTHEAYTCLLNPTTDELYISLWGSNEVAIFNTKSKTIESTVQVGHHPSAMIINEEGSILYVANANSNTISVIDIGQRKVLEHISTTLYPDAPAGSTPNSMALSPDEHLLYIANADNNCVAIFDVENPGHSKAKGFIPTGWYPTSVMVSDSTILVANGKGEASSANPNGPNPYLKRDEDTQYIGGLFKGSLSIISVPDAATLSTYSKVVYSNTPYSKELEKRALGADNNPIPRDKNDVSPIKHVFYVIKENRTYDQVFGDMPRGNGDSTLCLFNERISPNHHKLASEFVLFDNFYVDAEVSADGHNWSTAAYANDYVEKTWPTMYGQRGGTYDYEGDREIAFPEEGFIWDYCQRAGISYRSYGEFVRNGKAMIASLNGNIDKDYPNYNLSIMDTLRVSRWKHDFDSLLAIDAVPQFNTIRICNDHTSGAKLGAPTPRAHMADNDLALGRMIEHISNSSIWKESVIFVLEDDAQNGSDHVDAHRSILLAVSPYAKREYLDHYMYSTSSVLRTMELILGLPPMSQYDAAATPLFKSFTNEADFSPYLAVANSYPLDEKNTEKNKLSELSEQFNLDVEDAAPDIAFNEVIWKTIKGIDSEMPAPRRGAFVKLVEDSDD